MKTISRISAGSVFKVSFVTYALLLGLVGCFVVVLPGVFGSSLLGGLAGRDNGSLLFGAGLFGTLVTYIFLVVGGALVQGVVMAIAALLYNLVASWAGGIQIELEE